MIEEFEGNVPEIEVVEDNKKYFYYFCAKTERMLSRSCRIMSEKCYDCLGLNPEFINLYIHNNLCSCGRKVDFGYFMIIFYLEEAGLLPKDFVTECCLCKEKREKK